MSTPTVKDIVRDALEKYRRQEANYNSTNFVAKVAGKGLSTNDYTTPEQTKLQNVEATAQVNKIEKISVNGLLVPISSDTKTVNLDLSNYATSNDLASALTYKGTVQTFGDLPTDTSTLKTGYVYNIQSVGSDSTVTDANGVTIKAGDNVIWNGTGWDDVAGTVNLSAYVQTSALTTTLQSYVQKDGAKGLSTNDFTDAYKQAVDDLVTGAGEYVTDEEIAALFT